MNKYGAIKTTVDGITFDSKHEAQRYTELVLLLKEHEITNLCLQPIYEIRVNGKHVCNYIADFRYTARDGKEIVEDAKGVKTPVYRLKKKLVKAIYGIDIVEV